MCIRDRMKPDEKKKAYAADITYGTNNEFGFDFLRDNMALYQANLTQRGHAFAIVDEVDSIPVSYTHLSFSRSFDLTGINADQIKASYADGVLKLNLPKLEAQKPEVRRLEIE